MVNAARTQLFIWLCILQLLVFHSAAGKEAETPAQHAAASGPTSGMADVKGGKLYYESNGTGAALVLIHGGGFDRRMWDDQFNAFAAHHKVIRYDVRDFGQSPRARGDYTNAADLYELLNALHVSKAAIVGVSLGGRIAIDFALAHPDMVAALIPVATGVSGFQFSDEFLDRAQAVGAAASMQGAARAAQLWLDDPLFSQARKNPNVHHKLLEIAAANGDSWQISPADSRPAALDRLAEIRAPTLVVVGSDDIPDIQQIADIVAAKIPGAKKAVIPQTDHALNLERPDQFNRIVLEFLERTRHDP